MPKVNRPHRLLPSAYGEYIFLTCRKIRRRSKQDGRVTSTASMVMDAVLKITKSQNVVSVAPGSEIEFT